jgi:hypothetical protein
MSETIGIAYTVEQEKDGVWVPIPLKYKGDKPIYGTPKRGFAHRVARRYKGPVRVLIAKVGVDKVWWT